MEETQFKPLTNETVLLREVNERVLDFARSHEAEDTEYDFLCECGDPSCTENVTLTTAAYVEWADQGLVVAEGHSA